MITLSGPQGNAFHLMAMVNKLGMQLGLTSEKINEITHEMRSLDYNNLLKTFAKNFGMVVELYKDGKLYEWEYVDINN
jgi:hypothetical protein